MAADRAQGAWQATGQLATPRTFHAAALLPDGRVLVCGGYDSTHGGTGRYLDSAEIYDPATGSWSQAARLRSARSAHTLTALRDGRILALGGDDRGSAEIYEPGADRWRRGARLHASYRRHTATLLADGTVLVAGADGAEVYDPASGRSRAVAPLRVGRVDLAAAPMPDGRVLVAGGGAGGGGVLMPFAGAEIYEPGSAAWWPVAAMAAPRASHSATLLSDGRILVAGGNEYKPAELFDPATLGWQGAAAMETSRSAHTATLLPDGQVLVTGGSARWGVTATAECYDPASGRWRTVAPLATARRDHTATLLRDGRVLVAGGVASESLATAELWSGLPPSERPNPPVTPSAERADPSAERRYTFHDAHAGSGFQFLLSPDHATLATVDEANLARLWRVRDGALLHTLNGGDLPAGLIFSLAFSPDGALLAWAAEKEVRLWRVRDGAPLHRFGVVSDFVGCVLFSPDGQFLASTAGLFSVWLWRVADGAVVQQLPLPNGAGGSPTIVVPLAFSPDGGLLAAGGQTPPGAPGIGPESQVFVWQVPGGAHVATLTAELPDIATLDFAADERVLVARAADGAERRWSY